MTKLAIHGGMPVINKPLRPYNTIGRHEREYAMSVIDNGPLSGFLGGELEGGTWVRNLEAAWCHWFKCKHAISFNSATSALWAAGRCAPPGPVCVSPFTMSATAIAFDRPKDVVFKDIEPDYFCLDPEILLAEKHAVSDVSVISVTNLFGHPAELSKLRKYCDDNKIFMIEDNAQSIMAKEKSKFAGTIGHIGVFSLNVHKHIQCGEGGVAVTDDDDLAFMLKRLRNHGELYSKSTILGMNLRMTEITAAIACAQLERLNTIVAGRVAQAKALTAMVKDYPFIKPAKVRPGCTHVYYHWPFTFDSMEAGVERDLFIRTMCEEGVPLEAGYVEPLYRLPVFSDYSTLCINAESAHHGTLGCFSNCQYDPTDEQLKLMAAAFAKVADNLSSLRRKA